MPSFRLPPTRNNPKDDLSDTIGTPGNPYPASVTLPLTPDPEAPFDSNDQVPYRGAVPHGVALHTDLTADNTDVHQHGVLEPYTPGQEGAATRERIPSDMDYEPGAVPVRIVASAPPLSLRKRFGVYTITFNVGDAPKRIAAFRPNRTKLTIQVKPLALGGTADRVWFGNDEGFNAAGVQFYPLDATDPPFNLNTTDDIWGAIDPAGTHGTMVCVYTEFEIEALTESELNPHKGKRAKHN